MTAERCTCPMTPGMSSAELREVQNCAGNENWICRELVKARVAATKREASRERIGKLLESQG